MDLLMFTWESEMKEYSIFFVFNTVNGPQLGHKHQKTIEILYKNEILKIVISARFSLNDLRP